MTPDKPNILAVFLLAAFLLPLSLFAADAHPVYSDTWVGLSWEFCGHPADASHPVTSLVPQSLSLMGTFGDRSFTGPVPIRLRAGLGWWPSQPFAVIAGLEFAFFEMLNPMQARMFGIYGYLDGIVGLKSGVFSLAARPSARLLIPLTSVGGIAIGAGYDTRAGFTVHLDFLTGAYLMN